MKNNQIVRWWWCTPLALGGQRKADLCVSPKSEFQYSQGCYKKKLHLEKKNNKTVTPASLTVSLLDLVISILTG